MGGIAECGNWPGCGCTKTGHCVGDEERVTSSGDVRLKKIQAQLDASGMTLRGITWGEEAGTKEERKHAMADYLEAYLRGDGVPAYFLHDDLLSGEELVKKVYVLEQSIRDLMKYVRYTIDQKKVDPGFYSIGIARALTLIGEK